ncbi:MAG TPA: TolC family protein [Candidatus Omnitrophota bacterium]|nr:TolC family protein [Candidatus Omnitrophota bacterium]
MKIKTILAIAFFITAANISTVHAANNDAAVTLDDCYRAALKQSETVATQQETIHQAEEHYRQALAVMLPNLGLGYSLQKLDSLPDQDTGKAYLSLPLFRGFRDFATLKQNQSVITSQKQAYRWAALQLYGDVSQAFFLAISLEQDLAILQKESGLYDQRVKDLSARVAIGRSRRTDVLSVQAARAALAGQIEQVKAQLMAAREMLSFLTGRPSDIKLSDQAGQDGELGDVGRYLKMLEQRPDIGAAKANVEAAEKNVEIANGAMLPSADLAGNAYLNQPHGPGLYDKWDAQISVTLPVFTGWYNTSKKAEAGSLLKQSRIALQLVKRQAEENLRTVYEQVASDREQIARFGEAARLAEQNYKAVAGDYELGLVSNLDVLTALTSYQDASRSLNRAVYALKSDRARLTSITAGIDVPEGGE